MENRRGEQPQHGGQYFGPLSTIADTERTGIAAALEGMMDYRFHSSQTICPHTSIQPTTTLPHRDQDQEGSHKQGTYMMTRSYHGYEGIS